MKVAIVYDRVNKWGGAERVLLTLQEMFPEAEIYTSVYDPNKAPWAKVFPKVNTSFLQRIPYLRNRHELLGTFMPIAFESLDFSREDLVISVTSEAAKGIITKPPTKHICIMLTPTRYLWSHHETYLSARDGPAFGWKGIAKPLVNYLRWWDKIAAYRPDKIVAISSTVQKRIKRYYKRDSIVVYPPVDVKVDKVSKTPNVSKEDYYLLVSRLVPYKRIDLAIEAFIKMDRKLVIVGVGGLLHKYKFKYKSKKKIIFTGFVNEEKLVQLYQGAKALIMPQEEDFGIVAVEAQSLGCPVIAYGKGGALDSVVEGVTGVFFEKQTVDSLVDAVKRFGRMKFDTRNLRDNAKRFSKENFKKEFNDYINLL